MSSSYTVSATGSETFTLTHAKHIASKVATDLKRFQRLYDSPTDYLINLYEAELVTLLKYDAVDEVVYGFKRNDLWTMASVRYVALPGGVIQTADDDPGKIRPGVNVHDAHFTSFLKYSSRWFALSQAERAKIENDIPLKRSDGTSPGLETGSWTEDRKYVAGGRGLGRSTIRS